MAVTDFQSLYGAVNRVAQEGVSSIQSIGGYDTFIELHTQNDIDKNWEDIQAGNYDANNNKITKCVFGSDSDQSHVILIVAENIEIPSGYTLTPVNPKKSLVILCDKFTNNGIVSMTAKGPNILPHDWFLIGQTDGYDNDIIIPAYANNQLSRRNASTSGANGNAGVNRQCGSGGQGTMYDAPNTSSRTIGASGSGTAFAGGAGSGGSDRYTSGYDVDSTYPMRGGRGAAGYYTSGGGVGNPIGANGNERGRYIHNISNNFGVGGRIIIFCTKFINNGTISSNGVSTRKTYDSSYPHADNSFGGASGGGAIDIFYTKLITQGTITANGGGTFSNKTTPGKGGNGSVTLTQYSASAFILPGYADKKTLTKFVELVKTGLAKKADKTDVTQAIGEIIDDTIISYAKTYSSEKIEDILPRNITDLVNDAGFVGRHITAKEVQTMWDDTEVN